MKALVLLLACLSYLGGLPVWAQEEGENQGIKVYWKFVDDDREYVIYLSYLDGSGERELAVGNSPALSPDQNTVVYVRISDLYLMDLDTEVETLLFDNATYSTNMGAGYPHWHPNGRTIFFDFGSLALENLWAIESDGTNPRRIMADGFLALGSWPSPFSPDGRKFLYTDCFDECATLGVVDLDAVTGSTDTSFPRTRLSRRTDYGAWSPDGRYVAFGASSEHWRGPGLFVSDVDGQVQTVLEDVQVGSISWSLDSARIAFTQVGESLGPTGNTGAIEVGSIYEVDLDGTGLRSRDAHFEKWEFASDSTPTAVGLTSERTWGQVKREQR